MSLLNLPDDVFEKVLSYISYDEVSRCRLVCRKFNYNCKRVLNKGFHKVKKYHAQRSRNFKLQSLKLEAEGRKHPLALHLVYSGVHINLFQLEMTFGSYLESNIGCFIPGKILDEIYIILRSVTSEQTPGWINEVSQKLQVLTSLAVEHFSENISPAYEEETLKKISEDLNNSIPPVPCHCECSGCHLAGEQDVHKEREEGSLQEQNATSKKVQFLEQKVSEVNKTNSELEKKVNELQALLAAQVENANEQDLRLKFISELTDGRPISPSKPSNQSKVKNSLTRMKSSLIKDNQCTPPKKKRQANAVFRSFASKFLACVCFNLLVLFVFLACVVNNCFSSSCTHEEKIYTVENQLSGMLRTFTIPDN